MRWDERFFASTPGQIVAQLRRASHTVDELAHQFNLTKSGIRAHLAMLERDGLVRRQGVVRRGRGKPAYLYELTPEAERLFSRASEPLLRELLDVLAEQLGAEEFETLLAMVGRRLVAGRAPAAGDLRARLAGAIAVIEELGGLVEVDERDDAFVVCCYSWPLTATAPDYPALCRLTEAMLTALVGAPVREHGHTGDRPGCCFTVAREGVEMRALQTLRG